MRSAILLTALLLSSALAAAEWDLADLGAAWRDLSTATSPAIRLRGAVILALDGDPRTANRGEGPGGTWTLAAERWLADLPPDRLGDEPLARPWVLALAGRARSALAELEALPATERDRGEGRALRAFITRDPGALAAAAPVATEVLVRASLDADGGRRFALTPDLARRIGPLARQLVGVRIGGWEHLDPLGEATWGPVTACFADLGTEPDPIIRAALAEGARWVRRRAPGRLSGWPYRGWFDQEALRTAWIRLDGLRAGRDPVTDLRIRAAQERLAWLATSWCTLFLSTDAYPGVIDTMSNASVHWWHPSDPLGLPGEEREPIRPHMLALAEAMDLHVRLTSMPVPFSMTGAAAGRLGSPLRTIPGGSPAVWSLAMDAKDKYQTVGWRRRSASAAGWVRGLAAALAADDRRGRLAVARTALVMDLPWSVVADTGAPAQAAEDPWDPAAGILTAAAGIVENDADLGSGAPRASATAAVPERWSLGLDAPWTPPRPTGDGAGPPRLRWTGTLAPGIRRLGVSCDGPVRIELDGRVVLRRHGRAVYTLRQADTAVAGDATAAITITWLATGRRPRLELAVAGDDGRLRVAERRDLVDMTGTVETGPWPDAPLIIMAGQRMVAAMGPGADRMDAVRAGLATGWRDMLAWAGPQAGALADRLDGDPHLRSEWADIAIRSRSQTDPARLDEARLRWGPLLLPGAMDIDKAAKVLVSAGRVDEARGLLDRQDANLPDTWEAYLEAGLAAEGARRIRALAPFQNSDPDYSREVAAAMLALAAGDVDGARAWLRDHPCPRPRPMVWNQWDLLPLVRTHAFQRDLLAAVPETSGWCTVLAGLDVGRLPTWEYMEQKKDATSDHIEEPWCEWLVLRAFLYARDPARPAKAKPPTVPAKAYRFTVPDWVAPTVDGMLNGRAVVVPESATKPVACRWRVIWAVANQDLAGARAALERVPAGQDRAAAEVFLAWAESQGVESLAAHPVWGRRTPATSQTDPPAAPPHPEKPRPETPRREPPAHPPSPEPPRPEPTGASGF